MTSSYTHNINYLRSWPRDVSVAGWSSSLSRGCEVRNY